MRLIHWQSNKTVTGKAKPTRRWCRHIGLFTPGPGTSSPEIDRWISICSDAVIELFGQGEERTGDSVWSPLWWWPQEQDYTLTSIQVAGMSFLGAAPAIGCGVELLLLHIQKIQPRRFRHLLSEVSDHLWSSLGGVLGMWPLEGRSWGRPKGLSLCPDLGPCQGPTWISYRRRL